MVAWREHVKALAVVLGGAGLGALWALARWMDDTLHDLLGLLPVALAAFVLLGVLAQRWLSPAQTAALAVAFLAGQVYADGEYSLRDDGDVEGFGAYPPVVLFVMLIVAMTVGLALLGHWATGVVQRRLARQAGS